MVDQVFNEIETTLGVQLKSSCPHALPVLPAHFPRSPLTGARDLIMASFQGIGREEKGHDGQPLWRDNLSAVSL